MSKKKVLFIVEDGSNARKVMEKLYKKAVEENSKLNRSYELNVVPQDKREIAIENADIVMIEPSIAYLKKFIKEEVSKKTKVDIIKGPVYIFADAEGLMKQINDIRLAQFREEENFFKKVA